MTPTDRAILLLRLRETCGELAELCRVATTARGPVKLEVEKQQIVLVARMDRQLTDLSRAALADEMANLAKEEDR